MINYLTGSAKQDIAFGLVVFAALVLWFAIVCFIEYLGERRRK